jgi:hypothetical protein
MATPRCEEVVIQLVIRSYDAEGRPVREQISQAVKVFRNAETLDFWGYVDQEVAKIVKAQQAERG